MAQLKTRYLTLCALLLALFWTPFSQASHQTRTTEQAHSNSSGSAKKSKGKKNQPAQASATKHSRQQKSTHTSKTHSASAPHAASKAHKTSPAVIKKTPARSGTAAAVKTAQLTQKCVFRKGYKKRCSASVTDKKQTLAQLHKARVQKAQKTAMNKLMGQLGKPYRWGGTSPVTGFDCSGLVYYAYKDLVNFRIPRTANEMYHLEDAASVKRSELESGDLVFFRIQGRGTADHVGVYVGNGKFIQSPRTGRDIQITSLSEDYWQRHYVGARRVMTPKTLR